MPSHGFSETNVLGTVSVKYEDAVVGTVKLVAAEDVEREISAPEVFMKENTPLVIVLAVALGAVIILVIVLIAVLAARKRRKARAKGRRFRD